MPGIFIGTIDDVTCYEGKNGWRGNLILSTKVNKRRKTLEIPFDDRSLFDKFEENIENEVTVKIILESNKFGLRFGEVLEVVFN